MVTVIYIVGAVIVGVLIGIGLSIENLVTELKKLNERESLK